MHAVIGSYIKTPGQLSRVYANSYVAPCNSYLYMHPFRMLATTCYLCRKQIYTTSYTERAILMRHTYMYINSYVQQSSKKCACSYL